MCEKEKKKIIFLMEYPFNQRDFQRFGIEIIRKHDFEVEVWDLTPCLRPEASRNIKIKVAADFKNLIVFNEKKEVLKKIASLNEDCFMITLIPLNFDTYGIYRAISKKKIKYGIFLANAVPMSINNTGRGWVRSLIEKLAKLRMSNLFLKLFSRIPCWCLGIAPAYLALAGGKKSIFNSSYPISPGKTKLIWIHTLDYDTYLQEMNKPSENQKEFAVFLDENVPFHTDYLYLGVKPFSGAQDYYPHLCCFFDRVEKKTGLKVVIAAHPRSDYQNGPDYFSGREIIRNKTAQLVKNSSFVIAHSSTAISFAVLFRKPIVFITTDSMNDNLGGKWVGVFADTFGKKVINVNSQTDFNPQEELIMHSWCYAEYKENFIKREGSEDSLFWEVFCRSFAKK